MKKRIMRRAITGIAAGTLMLAMGTTALAATGNGRMQNGGPQGQGGMFGQMQDGERPALPDGEQPKGQMPQDEMQQGQMPQGEMPQGEMPQGEMPQGEMPQGEIPQDDMRGRAGDVGGRMKDMPMLNTDEIKEAIDALDDDDLKAELSELLEAYTEALEAEKEAFDTYKDSEEADLSDMDEYREAVKEAMDALQAALSDAGIELNAGFRDMPLDGEGTYTDAGRFNNDTEIANKGADISDKGAEIPNNDAGRTEEVNNKLNDAGILEKIGNWIKSLLGR